ncbi:hypothetical protein EYF80_018152 [Liparis tanakae]|uniref:Uncharacterized protein n=1 Tax=Liparis tanakae TaxID=230148 RepID=A0A4Z2I0Z6_9TELE|nr:hypothetical protein EYF80_018152 [Liparis tanakae]
MGRSRRGLETKRSLQPWTQVLELRFTPNPGLEREHRADAAKGFNDYCRAGESCHHLEHAGKTSRTSRKSLFPAKEIVKSSFFHND